MSRVTLRPAPALVRATVLGVVGLVGALLMHRPAAILVPLGLLVWAIAAMVRRQLDGGTTTDVRGAISRARVREGDAIATTVRASGPLPVTAMWPRRAGLAHAPRYGAVLSVGEARASIRADAWGSYQPGPVRAVVSDPLGALRGQVSVPLPGLSVTPDSETLTVPPDVPRTIGVSGPHLSPRRGSGTALAEVREFARGDRLARINWPVTSRTGRLHTNATFTEQDTDVVIVVDTLADVPADPTGAVAASRAEGAPTDGSSLDLTVRATAAIARHYLGIGDRVGIRDLGGLIGDVRTGAGGRQLGMIMTALSRASRTAEPLARVRPVGGIRPGSMVVVCSPLLEERAVERVGELASFGAELLVIDTLPGGAGASARPPRRSRTRLTRSAEMWDEAWALRRLQQQVHVRALRERGIPVVAWEDPATLASVLMAMSRAAAAPRMGRR